MKINPLDHKFVPTDPEPGFSPEHNKRVVERTIKKTDMLRKKNMQAYQDQLGERTEAAAFYLKSKANARTDKSVDKYFGKRNIALLRGEHIASRLRDGLGVVNQKGKVIRQSKNAKKK